MRRNVRSVNTQSVSQLAARLDGARTLATRVARVALVASCVIPAVAHAQVTAAATATDSARARRDSLERVVITAVRPTIAAPTAQSMMGRDDIQRRFAGQDAPLFLQSLPGLTSYSEAGGYSGYSYLRLRGVDQTRLNISVDGVPLNDPEDQVLYFSNVPDFLSSMQSVQVQRGVGASAFGTASYAGSLNFQPVPLATTPRGGAAEFTGGSFNTMRASVQGATGMLDGGFAAYARLTKQHTDGYREHSGNDAQSGFVSAAWFSDRSALKFTGFAGVSGIREAYLAAPEADLAVNRRLNPLTEHEGDRFHQEMASLQYSRSIGAGTTWSATAYRNSAAGAFDVDFGDGTIGNYVLAHVWYGAFTALNVRRGTLSFDAGAHLSDYHRDHALAMRPTLSLREYTNTGYKQEQSAFAKLAYDAGSWRWSADLQLRRAAFRYAPDAHAGIPEASLDWTFVNPKVGVTWRASNEITLYASYGRTGREPARGDLFAGADDVNASNAASVLPLTRVQPETLGDLEVGATWHAGDLMVQASAFDMQFRNEIAPIGQLSLTGSPLRKNVGSSARTGIELDATWQATAHLTITGNIALLHARIDRYTDDAAAITYNNVEPLLSPPVVANQRVEWQLSTEWSLSLGGRFVDRMRLANDGNAAMVVPANWLADGGLTWQHGGWLVRAQLANLLDANAYAGGYAAEGTRYFYPVASRNVLITTRRSF